MLIIRLRRVGKKKQPTYRLIISEKARDTQGRYLELLGTYNPRSKPPAMNLESERITYWLSKGAQTSETVHNLLVDAKLITDKKLDNSKSKPGKKKAATQAAKAKDEAAAKAAEVAKAKVAKEAAEAPAPEPVATPETTPEPAAA